MISVLACGRNGSQVAFVVRNAGSDTVVNVAQAWAEEYAKVRPTVSVEVSGGGTATGFAALVDGSADLANCSRPATREEIESARRKRGLTPKEWIVGYDALAIYVHRSNPLEEISLDGLAEIYGSNGRMPLWSSLGVRIPGAADEMILISRQSNSGTHEYFRRAILGPGEDLRLGTRDLNGSKEVVTLVASTPGAIGYSGMGYATSSVKMLRVSKTTGAKAHAPNSANVIARTYPITRPLFVYTLGDPRGATAEYLAWILSPAGQRVVSRSGYVPMGNDGVLGRLRGESRPVEP
ncbi:MAG: phosphate ABC transporter substrate-binding protein [Bryobacteraceae bacterium]